MDTKLNQIGGQVEGTVKWISSSEKNNSFNLIEDDKIWYQLPDEQNVEDIIKRNDKIIVKFKLEGNTRLVEEIKVLETTEQTNDLQDDMVNFETLLDAAHKKNENFSITTECIEVNLEKKYALFKAIVTIPGNPPKIFTGHGDATNENVKGVIKEHFIRMAESRSIVRALRWYTNNASIAIEETSEQ